MCGGSILMDRRIRNMVRPNPNPEPNPNPDRWISIDGSYNSQHGVWCLCYGLNANPNLLIHLLEVTNTITQVRSLDRSLKNKSNPNPNMVTLKSCLCITS